MSAKVAPEDGAVGAAKMGKKKKEKKGADDKKGAAASAKTRKGDEDPFGKPDEYPTSLALGPKQFVEFHERADPSITLATYMEPFQEKLLPREQVMCFQQLIVFNQMVGRMIDTTAKFAYETDYNELLNKLCAGVKKVLGVQKVRLFGVDYNSLGMARELWLVGGERSLLGHPVALEEWAGCCATGKPIPIVSHAPHEDHKRYGINYMDMDMRAKFNCQGLCSVGVRMRDPLAGKSRPRYVLEVYNKQKIQGKGIKDFDETDAYVTGCVARACGAAIAWVLGNMQNARCSEFASAVLTTNSLKEFTQHSCRTMERLFNCEEAVLFWVDEEHESLWRFPTEEEVKRNEREKKTMEREFVPFDTACLAMEAFKKIKETSIAGATVYKKVVTNIADAYRDIRFDPQWDRKSGYRTRSILCVPIIDVIGGDKCIGCLQLINKKDNFGRLYTKLFNARDEQLAHNLASVVTIAVKAAEQEGNAGASLDLAVGVAMRRTEDKGGAPAAVE